jgi:HK97 family phage major capsid protein
VKLSLKRLRALAEQLGYSGDKASPDAILAFVKSYAEPVELNGKPFDCKSVELEGVVTKSVTLADDSEPATKTPELPHDFAQRIEAGVAASLKSAGILDAAGKRPVDTGAIVVKSGEQRAYEDKIRNKTAAFNSYEEGRAFTDYVLAMAGEASPNLKHLPSVKAFRNRLDQNPVTKAYGTNTTAGGGALTDIQFSPDILRNINRYGVIRKIAKVVPMTSERTVFPVSTGLATLYYPDQNTAITQSTTPTFSNKILNVKNGKAIVQISNEMIRDAYVPVMDHFAEILGQTVAYTEDQAAFNGAGETTYGGMVGIQQTFKNLGTTLAQAASGVAAGADWTAYTSTTLADIQGRIPAYAREKAVWVCAPEFQSVLIKLARASGGVTYKEFQDFGECMVLGGKPVIHSNVMNTTSNPTANQFVDIYYGDFSRCILFGARQDIRIDVSEQAYWTSDAVGMRITVGHDINVWDVGSTTVAGPVAYGYTT